MSLDGRPVSIRSQIAAVEELRARYAADPRKGNSWALSALTLQHIDAALKTLRELEPYEAAAKRAGEKP